MRIVHVVDSMEVGGAEIIVAVLCRLQRQQGNSPSICCLYRTGVLGETLSREGFDVTCLGPASLPTLMLRLHRHFSRLRPDAVHCHNAMATIAAAIPGKLSGANVISTRHGLVPPPFKLRQELKYWTLGRPCDAFVGVCNATTRNLNAMPLAKKSRVKRVYNGCPQVAAVRTRQDNDFALVIVGRLATVKDHETLLRAVALASSHLPSLQLNIVGDGPLAPKLKELSAELGIAARVHFLGEQSQANVAQFLMNADAFVLSSQSEGLPMSLLEAMSAGLPAIVTSVGGMPEVIELSQSGITVPPQNPEALSAAICQLARDPASLAQMRENALRTYRQHFTLEHMAGEYMRLYNGEGRKEIGTREEVSFPS